MPNLKAGLKRSKGEKYTRQQLVDGLKHIMRIVLEIGGLVTVMVAVAQLLSFVSGWLTLVGISLSPYVVRHIMQAAARGYITANEEERKQIRAVPGSCAYLPQKSTICDRSGYNDTIA